jgi:hypothetical protein
VLLAGAAAGANARCRGVAAGGVVQERLITVGRVADPLSWGFLNLVSSVSIRGRILSWIGTN